MPSARLPCALLELHHATAVGAPAHLTMLQGDRDGPFPGDALPGRFFARWTPARLHDVLVGAGFDVLDLAVDAAEDGWMHALVARGRGACPTRSGPACACSCAG